MASFLSDYAEDLRDLFQSRCRDWVVGEPFEASSPPVGARFQSRCRDWVVGERILSLIQFWLLHRFSLVAEIGWLAR